MRILIFSDTHLTDKFDEKKYIFLQRLISSVDQVIINGDFWDGAIVTFSQFVNSRWKNLFPSLKKKKAVYLYGNHDKKTQSDNRVSLFSVRHDYRYIIRTKKNVFIVEHGDKFQSKAFEHFRFLPKGGLLYICINTLFDGFERLLFRILGKDILQKKLYGRLNIATKNNVRELVAQGAIFVCGHTHAQEFDLKNHFINTGIFRHGHAQYLLINGNEFGLRSERYDK